MEKKVIQDTVETKYTIQVGELFVSSFGTSGDSITDVTLSSERCATKYPEDYLERRVKPLAKLLNGKITKHKYTTVKTVSVEEVE